MFEAANKYPDAINISEAKALLQTIRSAQESKKQELWNRIMVNEGKFPSSQGRSYKRHIKDENYENYEPDEDGNIIHKTKPVKIRIKDEN